eukprot:CAMPEP_0204594346 /NCGR_PEP_ID=MMETSP0661-20131031/52024_1 /ASSEMBLY_ACC=CAM_ASM_000606 /TAXON_ID=109239 /ORGANISM="Alexandrium margalefi, Strain AMGDE01CS-322" /LENGTH=156 /DNA_ID=CAMNT_0051604733 /DNA_START=23 /DNA_END=493 /DNA_ORIENTATION=+
MASFTVRCRAGPDLALEADEAFPAFDTDPISQSDVGGECRPCPGSPSGSACLPLSRPEPERAAVNPADSWRLVVPPANEYSSLKDHPYRQTFAFFGTDTPTTGGGWQWDRPPAVVGRGLEDSCSRAPPSLGPAQLGPRQDRHRLESEGRGSEPPLM